MVSRRAFLTSSAATFIVQPRSPASAGGATPPSRTAQSTLDAFIRAKMRRDRIPGVAACLCTPEGIRWAGTYGWANIERRVPMTIDALQNICSISKTFTTLALMQLWEAGRFRLDDDVNRYLSFPVRNPNHPRAPITFRHLLTHRSSIRDGSAYTRRYQCGDPSLALGDWIRGYLTEGGADYRREENFHRWAPETEWDYCNVAYGLIAHLVETIAGTPFPAYCRERIFAPLGMPETAWFLREIDVTRHVAPYTLVEADKARGPSWGGLPVGVLREDAASGKLGPGLHANCLYNHPNYPDGFLRTSVNQLSRYLRAHLAGGALGAQRLLQESTLRDMLTPQAGPSGRGTPARRAQGLTWYGLSSEVRGQITWGHGGSDPGINTDLRLLPAERIGAIVFMNTNGVRPEEITQRILEVAPELIEAGSG